MIVGTLSSTWQHPIPLRFHEEANICLTGNPGERVFLSCENGGPITDLFRNRPPEKYGAMCGARFGGSKAEMTIDGPGSREYVTDPYSITLAVDFENVDTPIWKATGRSRMSRPIRSLFHPWW